MRLTPRTRAVRTARTSCALLLLVSLSAAAQTHAPPAKPDPQPAPAAILGTWEGKYHDVPAITLHVKLDGDKLSGTAVFYRIVYKNGSAHVDGQVETALLEPKFDGATLTFKIKPPPPPPGVTEEFKPFAMELKLTGPDEGLAITKRDEEDNDLTTLKVVRKK